MNRFAAHAAVLIALGAGVAVLADETQNRPDDVLAGSSTEVTFTVATRDFQRGEDAAAATVWSVCSATVDGEVSAPHKLDGDSWTVSIAPAVGEHGEQRLVGCIEDATLDRVSADVIDIRHG